MYVLCSRLIRFYVLLLLPRHRPSLYGTYPIFHHPSPFPPHLYLYLRVHWYKAPGPVPVFPRPFRMLCLRTNTLQGYFPVHTLHDLTTPHVRWDNSQSTHTYLHARNARTHARTHGHSKVGRTLKFACVLEMMCMHAWRATSQESNQRAEREGGRDRGREGERERERENKTTTSIE